MMIYMIDVEGYQMVRMIASDYILAVNFSFNFHTVDDGAILDSTFRDFTYPPPDGYDRIMFEKSIL